MKRCHQALRAFRLPVAVLAIAALHAHAAEPEAPPEALATQALAGAYQGSSDLRRTFDLGRDARGEGAKLEPLRGRAGKADFASAVSHQPVAAGEPPKRDAGVRWSLLGPARPTLWIGWEASNGDGNGKGERSGFAEFGVGWTF